jgi:putative SOS response-associated peptidase YedK
MPGMCGRYAFHASREKLLLQFGLSDAPDIAPRYNIAPQSRVPIVRADGLVTVQWGLVPFWSKDPKSAYKMINARAETLVEKPAFREVFKRRRCLVPASGFYEWKQTATGKVPHYICMNDSDLFAFAGLWEHWAGKGERATETLETCAVITTTPNALCARIHDRMPVILDPADYARWLAEPALELLRPYPAEKMRAYPVSRSVNTPGKEGAALIAPAPAKDA